MYIPEPTTTTSPPETTTKPANTCNCVDDNEAICIFFGKSYCTANSYIGAKKFREYCQKMCDYCPPLSCFDRSYCVDIKQYCSMLAKVKPHPCLKTCNLC